MRIGGVGPALVACALGALAAPGGSAVAQAPGPVRVAGGVLDPDFPGAEIYQGVPKKARAPSACRVAETYVSLANSQKFDQLADLYADDAVVMSPLYGFKAVGKAAIKDFYRTVVAKAKPELIPVAYAGGPGTCFQVHAVSRLINGKKRFALATVDHFTFNSAGKITEMVAFGRPTAQGGAQVHPN